MNCFIKLEWFGYNYDLDIKKYNKIENNTIQDISIKKYVRSISMNRKPWVALIEGFDEKFKFKRKFVQGDIDYIDTNSKGSRGIYIMYILKGGCFYEIKEYHSWRRSNKYFCTIDDKGDRVEITEWELCKILSKK